MISVVFTVILLYSQQCLSEESEDNVTLDFVIFTSLSLYS